MATISKSRILILLITCIFSIDLIAQTDQSRIYQLNEISSGGHQQMIGKSLPPPEVVGSTYYSDQWLRGTVFFRDGKELEDILLKYDIANEIVETNDSGRKLAYKGEDVSAFQWLNIYTGQLSEFKKCKGYELDDTELVGFFEVILNDEVSFFAHPTIHVKEPDYVEGLDVGSRDYKIKKVEDYYLAFNKKLVELKKSKNIRALKSDIPGLKAFAKTNKLSFKDRNDLIAIAKYLNTINQNNSGNIY